MPVFQPISQGVCFNNTVNSNGSIILLSDKIAQINCINGPWILIHKQNEHFCIHKFSKNKFCIYAFLINCHDFHIDIVSGIELISAAVALKQITN